MAGRCLCKPQCQCGGKLTAVTKFPQGPMVNKEGFVTLEWQLWLQNIGVSLEATGAITSSGTEGIGYASGAGGTVTQSTSKSNGVSLNKTTGQITMSNAALASGSSVSFVMTNTTIAGSDLVIVNQVLGGTTGAYDINPQPANGYVTITVTNSSTTSLSEALVLGFAVIKGAIS